MAAVYNLDKAYDIHKLLKNKDYQSFLNNEIQKHNFIVAQNLYSMDLDRIANIIFRIDNQTSKEREVGYAESKLKQAFVEYMTTVIHTNDGARMLIDKRKQELLEQVHVNKEFTAKLLENKIIYMLPKKEQDAAVGYLQDEDFIHSVSPADIHTFIEWILNNYDITKVPAMSNTDTANVIIKYITGDIHANYNRLRMLLIRQGKNKPTVKMWLKKIMEVQVAYEIMEKLNENAVIDEGQP